METGHFPLTAMTLIIRCPKSNKREKRGQKLPANLSYVNGEHNDHDPHLRQEQMFNKLIFHLISVSKYIIWQQQQKKLPSNEKILRKTTQATIEEKLNPTIPLWSLSTPIMCQPEPNREGIWSNAEEDLGKDVVLVISLYRPL